MIVGPVVPINVTAHAARRYIERVANVSITEAREALLSPVILAACAFGAPFVRLPSGHRIVISGMDVVTVLQPALRGTLGR